MTGDRTGSAAARCALVVALLLSVLAASPARAQETPGQLHENGMDLRLFRPAVDSKGFITVNGTEVLPHKQFSFGLMLDGGFNILPFRGYVEDRNGDPNNPQRVDDIVDNFFTGTLHFNYGLFNRLIVGMQLPVHAVSGPRMAVPGAYNGTDAEAQSLDYQGIGDLVVHSKLRLLRAARDPIGLAAIVQFTFPTGESSKFAGEPGVGIWPSLAAEWRPHERVRLGLNAGYRLITGGGASFPVDAATEPTHANRATEPQFVDGVPTGSDVLTYDDLITFGFGASFRVADSLDIVGELYGTQVATGFGDEGATSMEALGGLKIFVQKNSYLLVAGGGGLPTGGFQRADYRATLGFVFEPSIGDKDGDGIPDDMDECPEEPEDFDDFEDDDGCPDPDNDGDGILDEVDDCPDVPEDLDGFEDDDGCPEGGSEGDRDGDGILDEDDECPDEPEDKDGFEDDDGCPDPDNDGDGILDVDDMCPDEAEDMDGFEDEDGCPDPDNDNDRILDEDDACPNEPETYNGFEDEDGCPDEGSVVIEDNELVILQKIFFRTDSAEILSRSHSILDAVAATLTGNPQIKLLEVQGHADERGPDDYNLRLTRDRAASVVQALVDRGVERGRLRSAGYGELCPVEDRSTQAAWEKNRRVEFKIIETEDGPTGEDVTCPAARHLVPDQ